MATQTESEDTVLLPQHQTRHDGSMPSIIEPTMPSSSSSSAFGFRPLLTSMFRRSNTLSEVHPHPSDVEPVLPAMAVSADHETRLHRPMWAETDEGTPNAWATFRHVWREEFAEFWGTFMILLFGAGVECQVGLNKGAYGDYLQGRFSWAVGVAMAVWMSGGISGGHCNPTVTIVLALFRGFPKRKIPSFIAAQVAGATLASLLVYVNYSSAISLFEGGNDVRTVTGPHATAPFFFTLPASYLSYAGAFYTEFLSTAVLLAIIFALADKGNLAPPKGVQPIAMFLALIGIGAALGVNTGYAMNGARDTGPRIALWIAGYGSKVWTHDALYWLWAPWGAATAGGIIGASVYDAFIYTGRDSPFNRPKGLRKRT